MKSIELEWRSLQIQQLGGFILFFVCHAGFVVFFFFHFFFPPHPFPLRFSFSCNFFRFNPREG